VYSSIKTSTHASAKPDAHVVFCFAGDANLHKDDRAFDKANDGVLSSAVKRSEFKGTPGDSAIFTDKAGHRFIVLGLGNAEKLGGNAVRKAAGKLLSALDAMDVQTAQVSVNSGIAKKMPIESFGRVIGEGLGLASFTFDQFKKAPSERSKSKSAGKGRSKRLSIATNNQYATKSITFGLKLAESCNFARALAATPPNIATPMHIASTAQRVARNSAGLIKCRVIRGQALASNGLAGLMNVGKASANEPCLIEMTYTPKTRAKKTIMLVGKTVTYDTGGLSLKISNGMKGMKYDKCGGMAVLGAMHAVSWMKPKCKIVSYLPAAENSISNNAYRPDDIIEFLNGISVEVTNTDAEGRLVLADALAYGCKTVKPDAVLDLATLTGGIVVALGKLCAGLWCDDDGLREEVETAAAASGDRVWRMPLFDDYREMMKSKHADIWNSAPVRDAHPVQGAAFLSYFVDKGLPWAHIDIAGTATIDKADPPFAPGPTGFGVRLLAYYLEKVK